MTAYVTRAPLQLINNPHIMSEASRGHGRRTSARLADKEDAPYINGIGNDSEPVKPRQNIEGKQGKGRVNGASAKPAAKRKPAYDEEDDGFAFTRTRAKKARAEPKLPSTIEEGRQEVQAEPVQPRKSRKKSVGSPSAEPAQSESRVGKRRSARHSGEHESAENADPPALQVKKRRKDRNSGEMKPDEEGKDSHEDRLRTEQDPHQNSTHLVGYTFDVTKIALPFADTPIIRRNKEMRKTNGSRRSSLGNRGRRASSLIDTGKSNAIPHDEVESSEFYKHIESEGLSEPQRMKQLLMWCGTRAMGERPSFTTEDSNARLAAREIQSQLLKDFSTKSEMSDWFGRREATAPPSIPKENPKNLSNLAKIQELEKKIASLQAERQIWETLDRSPPDKAPMLPPLLHTPPAPSTLDADLLAHPTQTAALQTLQSQVSDTAPSLTTSTSNRIQTINQNLEFSIDTFATNIHAISAYKDAAEKLADNLIATSASALEKRDQQGRQKATGANGETGIRDVLRGLSRVIDR
ncbi:hypothetical protein N7G274_009071 [Stereocaulon virgatum]|uniref:Mis12-Mtw1 family protein n=1 Tax=Stereocaulon virgatum TaxID=373712 RepID=A0ABR3ZY27_9LECA